MAFTTWSALKTAILDDIANGSVLTSSYTINGRSHNFRTLKEVMDFLKFIDQRIGTDSGGGRNYAKFVDAG